MNIEHTVSQQLCAKQTFTPDRQTFITITSSDPTRISIILHSGLSMSSVYLNPAQLSELAELLKQFSVKHKEVNGL